MILVFASSKGGVGKSTICAALGAALALRGDRVLILDLDQNQTIRRWSRKTSIHGLTVEAVPAAGFTDKMRDLSTQSLYDHVLIDLAGNREVTMLKAISRADLVIIPAQASEPDILEALVIVGDIKDVEETSQREIPYRLLLTKMGSLRTRVSDFAYSELARLGLPLISAIGERTAYREMFLTGEPPTRVDPGKGAGAEILDLLDRIEKIVSPAAESGDLRARLLAAY